MAASLISSLPDYDSPIFAGNLPDLVFSGIDPDEGMTLKVIFDFFTSSPLNVLDETIFPDAEGNATIKIRQVVEASLEHAYPTTDMFLQSTAARRMSIIYDGILYHLTVIKGGLLIPESQYGAYDYETFFATNLLSWMPADRKLKYREPCFLNYFNIYSGSQLYAKSFYITEAGALASQEYAIYTAMSVNGLYTFNVAFNQLIVLTGESRGAIAFECYVKTGGNRISNTQRLTLVNDFDEHDDVFAFSNSVGGFETIRLTGQLTESPNHSPLAFKNFNNHLLEYEVVHERLYKKHSGFFNDDTSKKWVRDFLSTHFRFHMRITESGFEPERITLTNMAADIVRFVINSFEFTFKYANQIPWQMNVRDTLQPINTMDAIIPETTGDMPDSEFNEDFFNQTPLNQLTDELLNT